MASLRIETAKLDNLDSECLVLGCFADERPPRGYCGFLDWRLNGMISKQILEGRISGARLEKVLISPPRRISSERIMLIGLGNIADLNYDVLYSGGYALAEASSGLDWGGYAFEIPAAGRCGLELPVMTEAFMTGLYDFYNKTKNWDRIRLVLIGDRGHVEEIVGGLERFKKNTGDGLDLDALRKEMGPLTLF
jgi:hypothetical protein